MQPTRRETLALALAAGGLALPANARAGAKTGPEGQRKADLGDGRYRNPVLAGDRPDPNILTCRARTPGSDFA